MKDAIVPIAILLAMFFWGAGDSYLHQQNVEREVQRLEHQHVLPGDDNNDGHITEDESGWDCRTMGNRICGYQQETAVESTEEAKPWLY